MVIDDAEDLILWEGDVGNATFLVKVPGEAELGLYEGLATIRANGCQIARIHFTLRVGRFTFSISSTECEVNTHRRAFASYAAEDRDEVLARVQGIQKAAPNLEIFLNVLSLRSSKYWEEELKRTIPESDIFYLFWSQYARESPWVEKEWRCADVHMTRVAWILSIRFRSFLQRKLRRRQNFKPSISTTLFSISSSGRPDPHTPNEHWSLTVRTI
jgi:hypothetical protein